MLKKSYENLHKNKTTKIFTMYVFGWLLLKCCKFFLFLQKFTYETYVLGQEMKFGVIFFFFKTGIKNLLNTRN